MSQTFLKIITFLFLLYFVGLLSLTSGVDENSEGNIQIARGVAQCGHRLTTITGAILLSVADLVNGTPQVCTIHIENASFVHLFFRNETRTPHRNYHNAGNLINIYIHDHNPEDGGFPLDEWRGTPDNFVKTITGNTVWLAIALSNDHVISENLEWSVAYTAQVGEAVPSCDISILFDLPANGELVIDNFTFGSVANLQCFEGYVLEDGPVAAVCSIVDGELSWIELTAVCNSVCGYPPRVHHATARVWPDFLVRENRTGTNQSVVSTTSETSANISNITVSYICQEPFIINGTADIQCGIGYMGVPQWFQSPPFCIIPDCSTTTHISQHAGAIVNPEYPQNHLEGGSLICQWEITGPRDSYIQLNVTYLDLPDSPDVDLAIYDAGSARRHTLLNLTNYSELADVTTDTSRASIIYHGPPSNATGYRGFYIRYVMRSRDSGRRLASDFPVPSPPPPLSGDVMTTPITLAAVTSPETPPVLEVTTSTAESAKIETAMPTASITLSGFSENLSQPTNQLTSAEQQFVNISLTATASIVDDTEPATASDEPTGVSLDSLTSQSTDVSTNLYATTLEHPASTDEAVEQSTETTAELTEPNTRPISDESSQGWTGELSPTQQATTSSDQSPDMNTNEQTKSDVEYSTESEHPTEETIKEPTYVPSEYSTDHSDKIFPENSEEISTMSTTLQSTFQVTETSPETSTQQHPDNVLETTENSSKEYQSSASVKQTTDSATEVNINYSTLPSNETLPFVASSEDSDDDWKIAVGIIIPLIVLVAVLAGVYIFYRKKYPVRMIFGREFPKFTNPNYTRPGHSPSLIREDADFYFLTRNSSSVPSQEFNPVNAKIMYDNMGFVREEADDEDERERKFLLRKSWLFKKTDEGETLNGEIIEETIESSFTNTSLEASRESEKKQMGRAELTDTSVSKIVDEHVTPVPKPRRKKIQEIKNSDDEEENFLPFKINSENDDIIEHVADISPPPSVDVLRDGTQINGTDFKLGNATTSCVKTAMKLFQQPTFDEVWAAVKARSHSLSLERSLLDRRPRSFSVDPTKSARKMSLRDEVIFASHSTFLASHRQLSSSLSDGINQVTASVVAVSSRDRHAPTLSSTSADKNQLLPDEVDSGKSESTSDNNNQFENIQEKLTESNTFIQVESPTSKRNTDQFTEFRKSDSESTSSGEDVQYTVMNESHLDSTSSEDDMADGLDDAVKTNQPVLTFTSSTSSALNQQTSPDDVVTEPANGNDTVVKVADEGQQDERCFDNDFVYLNNKDEKGVLTLTEKTVKLNFGSLERKSTGSSTESVAGSSQSSGVESSGDEDEEMPNEVFTISDNLDAKQSKTEINKETDINNSEEVINFSDSALLNVYPDFLEVAPMTLTPADSHDVRMDLEISSDHIVDSSENSSNKDAFVSESVQDPTKDNRHDYVSAQIKVKDSPEENGSEYKNKNDEEDISAYEVPKTLTFSEGSTTVMLKGVNNDSEDIDV